MAAPMPSERVPLSLTEPDPPAGAKARDMASALIAIIVVRDSAAVLPSCLAALRREGVEAIVVDNASTDASARIAEEAGARVIRNAKNQGYGRAMNIGMRAARQPACLLLNPDLVLAPGSIEALVGGEAALSGRRPSRAAPRRARWAPVLPAALDAFAFTCKTKPGVPCVPEGDCCAPFLSGACLLVDRELVLSLGGFDDEIFLFYEDDDLCRRVTEAGRSLIHVHAALADP